MITIIIGTIAIIGVSFYAGFLTGWREREEKYWRMIKLVEAKMHRAEADARIEDAVR